MDQKVEPKGKPQMSLVAWEQLEDEARVWEHGIEGKNREPNNWRKATDIVKYKNSLGRHIAAFMSGEFFDPDSGLPHLDHARCNIIILKNIYKKVNNGGSVDGRRD
jgi:hypothetical protein